MKAKRVRELVVQKLKTNHIVNPLGFGDIKDRCDLFGDTSMLLCEIVIEYADGSEDIIVSGIDWLAGKSPILESSIYDGEVYNSKWKTTANKRIERYVGGWLHFYSFTKRHMGVFL